MVKPFVEYRLNVPLCYTEGHPRNRYINRNAAG